MRILTKDVVLSEAFANTEIERYTFRSPGQATSYFYGYTKLLDLRKDVEAKMGRASTRRSSTTSSSGRGCCRRICCARR